MANGKKTTTLGAAAASASKATSKQKGVAEGERSLRVGWRVEKNPFVESCSGKTATVVVREGHVPALLPLGKAT